MANTSWKKIPVVAGLLAMASSLCFADNVYQVTIDTNTYVGSAGGIYFQFNPGLNTNGASILIDNFSIDLPGGLGVLPFNCCLGDVHGSLDAPPLAIANTFSNNDYFQFLTFGNTIAFRVSFFVPGVLTGDSGSVFGFGVTGDDGFPILTTDPNGFLGQIEYDNQGRYSATVLSEVATINSPVPEPTSVLLLASTLLGLAVRRRFSLK